MTKHEANPKKLSDYWPEILKTLYSADLLLTPAIALVAFLWAGPDMDPAAFYRSLDLLGLAGLSQWLLLVFVVTPILGAANHLVDLGEAKIRPHRLWAKLTLFVFLLLLSVLACLGIVFLLDTWVFPLPPEPLCLVSYRCPLVIPTSTPDYLPALNYLQLHLDTINETEDPEVIGEYWPSLAPAVQALYVDRDGDGVDEHDYALEVLRWRTRHSLQGCTRNVIVAEVDYCPRRDNPCMHPQEQRHLMYYLDKDRFDNWTIMVVDRIPNMSCPEDPDTGD